MSKTIYNKLVRDKIPAIIESRGEVVTSRILTEREYKQALLVKLIEEAQELLESDGSLDERADVGEVLAALDIACGWSADQIEEARRQKNSARGAFTKRLFLEHTSSGE